MAIWKIFTYSGLFSICCYASAQEIPAERIILQDVVKTAYAYANSIACDVSDNNAIKNAISIIPWDQNHDFADAEYAVIWTGDVGCNGGKGSAGVNIAIVKIGMGNQYYVDPRLSSPIIGFDASLASVTKIVSFKKDVIVLEGTKDTAGASLRVQISLRRDKIGNWKLINEKRIK